MSDIIALSNVKKDYPASSAPALKSINLTVAAGKFIVLVGPSGCGKTTLISIIAGLETATSGEVHKPDSVAMMFQGGALLPWFTVWQNIAIVLKAQGLSKSVVEQRTREHIETVGLDEFKHKFPRELSGGQRQRVGLARALAVDPEVLVLDEPFSALDIETTELLHQDLLRVWRATGKTVVMVSHSIEEAVTLADAVILMKQGSIEAQFDLKSIPRPRREQAADFIREVQTIRQAFLAS